MESKELIKKKDWEIAKGRFEDLLVNNLVNNEIYIKALEICNFKIAEFPEVKEEEEEKKEAKEALGLS